MKDNLGSVTQIGCSLSLGLNTSQGADHVCPALLAASHTLILMCDSKTQDQAPNPQGRLGGCNLTGFCLLKSSHLRE